MSVDILVESQWSQPVPLTETEVAALRSLGRRLIGTKTWWGTASDEVDAAEETENRSILACSHVPGAGWKIRVRDATGLIAVGGRTLEVHPKIPLPHYLYLLEQGRTLPRTDPTRAGAASADTLWTLVASWYVAELARVVRADLIRDYREVRDTLQVVRGRLQVLPTASSLYKGRMALHCSFEEFDVDNPLNRILKAAARTVLASPLLDRQIRADAARLISRLDAVSEFQPDDLEVRTDLRTGYYRDALQLARHILAGQGRTLRAGPSTAWSFLLPSPPGIEAGLRRILAEGLTETAVTKGKRRLDPSNHSLNPDLVFDRGARVGDVKYSLSTGEWSRSHVYQATTFATGYRSRDAVVVGFRLPSVKSLPPVLSVGDVRLTYLAWNADDAIEPSQASSQLVQDCRAWLRNDDRSLALRHLSA